MKFLLASVVTFVLGSAAHAAAPECAIFLDGVQGDECVATEPVDKDMYTKSFRCGSGMVAVWIDYGLNPEIFQDPQRGSATLRFNYLEKIDGWIINNWTAAQVDTPPSNPRVDVVGEISNIIPAKDRDWYREDGNLKEMRIQCNLPLTQ